MAEKINSHKISVGKPYEKKNIPTCRREDNTS
jgi:hypothetical protein